LLFGVSAFAANDMIGSGYMDVPLATTVLAISLLSLAYFIKPRLETTGVIILLVLIANNLKQEGQIFVLITVIVIALAFLLSSRNYRRALKFLAPIGLVFVIDRLVWSRFSDFAELPDSSTTSSIIGNLSEVFEPGSNFYELFAQLIDRVGFVNLLFWQLSITAVIIASRLAFKSLVDNKTMLFLLALPVASAGVYVVTALTYTLGGARDRLDWWLGTSYGRITSTPELMLIGGLFVLALVISLDKPLINRFFSDSKEMSESLSGEK
jgi:drug/metabolite transporter superfamily protein YnfA